MAPELEKLLVEALKLPEEGRAALAARLIESLEGEVDEGAEAEWREELARRLDALNRGATETVSWDDARRAILSHE